MGKVKAATPAAKKSNKKNKKIKAVRGHPKVPGTKRKISYRAKKAIEKNKQVIIGKTCAKDGLNQRLV